MSATDTAEAAAGKANPARHQQGPHRDGRPVPLSFVGDKHAAVVDEPLHQPLSAARDSALRSDEAPARPAFSS